MAAPALASPLIVSRRTPTRDQLAAWMATVPGFIQGGTSVDGKPTRLYDYQVRFMDCPARFRAVLKARQTGFSFTFAAESLAKAILKAEHTSVFVSYNMDDASEKIRHAEMLYESLPAAWRKRRVTDNKTSLEFEDARGRRSRILSLPCREPRGKGKLDVYLDELPFMRDPRRIYTAALPMITRGGGVLTIASTPLAEQDIFHEIMTDEARYPLFRRFSVPWWECRDFCADVDTAMIEAPAMDSAARVARFGNAGIREIFASMDLDSFCQEYECLFRDARASFIPWELIRAAVRDRDELDWAEDVETFLGMPASGPLYAGYDVGRRRDAAELIVLERVGERFHLRLLQTLVQSSFNQQGAALRRLLDGRADLARLCIDDSGMGMQLGEELVDEYPSRAEAVTFTGPVKSEMAGGLKVAFDKKALAIPSDRNLMAQIHSVRRTVTLAGNIRLDVAQGEDQADGKHHADKFWALALALHAAGTDAGPAGMLAMGAASGGWGRA